MSFYDYAERIHRFTEQGYFRLGLDTLPEILTYHGPFKALRGFDYFLLCNKLLIDVYQIHN